MGAGANRHITREGVCVPQIRLEPGGRPPKRQLEPLKCPDGIWRLTRIRHRAFTGQYVRSSGSGNSRRECLADWEANFEKNQHKGSARANARRLRLQLTDPMLSAFDRFLEQQQKRVDLGKITQQTCDAYWRAIYEAENPRPAGDAVKLAVEMGHLSIGEAGKPVFLADYLGDIAEIVPGVARTQHVVLAGTFNMLTLMGLFDVSPMAPVPKPDRGPANQRALSPEERCEFYELILLRQLRSMYFRVFILTLLGTGIRPGEALAVRWTDIAGLDDDTVTNAIMHVSGTAVKLRRGGTSTFRQNKRKHRKEGHGYYITLPKWLTTELRAWKRICAPKSDEQPVFKSSRGNMIAPCTAQQVLVRVRTDTAYEWVTFGNFRDTVATHIAGKTGDPRLASAQLGHADGAGIATRHYIDPDGYVHMVVDNADVLEDLKPAKVGPELESGLVEV